MTSLPTPAPAPTTESPKPSAAPPAKGDGRGFRGARLLSDGIPQIFLLAWALLVILPMLWVLLSSLKTNAEIYRSPFALPQTWQFATYVDAWQTANIGRFFLNTVIVVVLGVFFTLLLSSMAAYVLARYAFPGSRFIYYLFLVGMTFPLFLAIVPLTKVTQNLGLQQSLPGLIIVYVAFSLPFSVFFLTAFFQSLPGELAESAFIDGAGHFRTFFQIMLPLAKPGLISIGVFNFLGQWNQYLLPLVLNTPKDNERSNFLLTQGLADLAQRTRYESSSTSLAEMFAGLVIAMIPVLVVYIVFQRKVEEGLTAGALK
ncbi:carbohydrate ABC transporter permease [Actinopolymorpha pittospori]|uniref:N-acetylglucosamine transport system permease protein n=1 Tax=Actinopolymorpha pittospori TaxID=648752 RepID=A0A927NBB4_9ACTN|nr:carbohydrate ABC transporter permease [Actinopolymorpha pittospori]MBE1612372.1 N-acetylglucosamine transport system permease protein [Actinopolymorpha pittospori]